MDSKHYQVVPFTGAQLPEAFRQVIIEGNQALHWNEAQSRSDFQLDQAEYYLLLDHDQVLGYVGLHHVLDEATLNLVYIKADLRGPTLPYPKASCPLKVASERFKPSVYPCK